MKTFGIVIISAFVFAFLWYFSGILILQYWNKKAGHAGYVEDEEDNELHALLGPINLYLEWRDYKLRQAEKKRLEAKQSESLATSLHQFRSTDPP